MERRSFLKLVAAVPMLDFSGPPSYTEHPSLRRVDSDMSAFIPERWALEANRILHEKMIHADKPT